MGPRLPSPTNIRIEADAGEEVVVDEENIEEEDQCSICLHSIVDRTVVPPCSHDAFCFECIVIWSEQSRRCPLCTQPLGDHLIHNIHSNYNYQKFYLPPLPSVSPAPVQPLLSVQNDTSRRTRRLRERQWGRRQNADDREDEFERALEKRRKIYRYGLYAKHTASNPHTKYKPYPTPAQFSANQELIARATAFLRRELRVWVNLDVEFLTTFIISIMKSIDIRTEAAIRLLSEFLDMDEHGNIDPNRTIAEHFAHEVYSFMRSPYKDLFVYDTVVQYDPFPESDSDRRQHSNRPRFRPQVVQEERPGSPSTSSRQRSPSPQRGRSPSHSPSRSRSISYSPSGRYYPRERHRVCSPIRSPSLPYREWSPSLPIDRTRKRWKGKERERTYDPPHSSDRRRKRYRASTPRSASPECSRSQRKGKERENTQSSPSRTLSAGPDSGEYGPVRPPSPQETRSNTTQTGDDESKPIEEIASKPARPPKRRTLLESVQDHLGTKKAELFSKASSSASRPALMDRLSFPNGTSIEGSVEGSCPPSTEGSTTFPTPANSNAPTPTSSTTTVSSPAVEAGDAFEKALPPRGSTDTEQPTTATQPIGASNADTRSMLLRRLLEEKKRTNPPSDPIAGPAPCSEAVESELRLRARLNTRKKGHL